MKNEARGPRNSSIVILSITTSNKWQTFTLNFGFLVGILLALQRETEMERDTQGEGELYKFYIVLQEKFLKVASTLPSIAACTIIYFCDWDMLGLHFNFLI